MSDQEDNKSLSTSRKRKRKFVVQNPDLPPPEDIDIVTNIMALSSAGSKAPESDIQLTSNMKKRQSELEIDTEQSKRSGSDLSDKFRQ